LQPEGFARPFGVGALRQNAVPPGSGHVRGVSRRGEQPLDEDRPLVGIVVGEKCPRFRHPRDHSGDVEIRPADELAIVGDGGGLDVGVLPRLGE
jgi:hypothetical protein